MTGEGNNLTNSEKYVSKFLGLLPTSSPYEATTWNARLSSENEAIVIPTQVIVLSFSSCSTHLISIFCLFVLFCWEAQLLCFLFSIIICKIASTG